MNELDSPRIAAAWTEAIVAKILEPLRPDTEERLRRIGWLRDFPDPDLAAATLIMCLVTRYAHGARPDDLIDRLVAEAEDPGSPLARDDARGLVEIARLFVLAGPQMPDPRWWRPGAHAEHLAIACARVAIGIGEDAEEMLRERFGFGPGQSEEMLEAAAHEPGVNFAIDREKAGPLGDRLATYLEGGVAAKIYDETLSTMPETVKGRLDLAMTTVQARQMMAASEGAERAGDAEVIAFIDTQLEVLAEAMVGMSRLEIDLMRTFDPDEQLLAEVAAIAKRNVAVSGKKVSGSREEFNVTGLTDLVNGERVLDPGLDLYLGLAGQSHQQRVGIVISWAITFERVLPDGFEGTDGAAIGVGLDPDVDTEFLVTTTYDGEEANSHIYYPRDSVTATLALAVLALTQRVRVDFYVLSGTRSIRHIIQAELPLKEPLATEVVARAVERCRELMADGEVAAMEALKAENSGEAAPLIAFLMNDSGKSEQLLDARASMAALGPGQSATPEQARGLAAARRRLLEAEAARIESPSEEADKRAGAEAAAYTALVQRTRRPVGRGKARQSIVDLETLVEGVASDRRAVVHLTIDSRGLELAWVDRAEGKVEVDLLTCADVDLDQLNDALSDPEAGSVDALDEPDGPGTALGRRLADQARERGVDQLLICATRNLHQLPVHALRVDRDDERRLIDIATVTYAPSAAIVAELARLAPRAGRPLIVAGGDLDFATDEAALVDFEVGGGEVLVGDQADPVAVLDGLRRAGWIHICSHGNYEPRDYLASGLELPTPTDPEGRLSVARILAEADLTGVDLAVLGACQSGAGQTETASLDVAGGIDTAFLAAGVRNVVSALWEIDDFGALLFHGELYRCLGAGMNLGDAYREAVQLLRSGAWRNVASLPLGVALAAVGVDLDAAMVELQPGDDGEAPIDFADLSQWAPFRLCGLGRLG